MEKETSCINSRAIIEYVRHFNNGEISFLFRDLDPEIDVLPDPENYLCDPNNWISCTIASILYKRARLIFNDEMVAFKIAKYTIENTALGYGQRILIKSFWSYKTALRNVQKLNDKWNRNKRVELVSTNANRAVIRLHWNPQMNSSKDICLYNMGAYTFFPAVWGGKSLDVRETCCYFEGAPYCEYQLKFPVRNRWHEIFSRFFTSRYVLEETIEEMEADKRVIEEKYEEVNRLNIELNNKFKQLQAIQDTGKAILSVLDLKQLLTVIMKTLSSICRIERALIMLVNEDEKYLEYLYGVGFGGEVPDDVKTYKLPLDRVSNILARVASTGKPEYIPDVETSDLRKENVILAKVKPKSVYVVPLITHSKVIGIIATDAVDEHGVPEDTRETLNIFSPQVAIAIDNAKLYRKLQQQMEELKQSHALLNRTEKFSFLGNLAARLAHEIKNPMTAINTFLQMLPGKFNDIEFRDNFHGIALEESKRINNLISELLNLAKTKESEFKPDDLHALIDKMVLLISPQSKAKRIKVDKRFDTNIEMVWMDSEKMKQVILNLLFNAVESLHDKGKIEISTSLVNCNGNIEGENIQIEIKDNGPGISQDVLDKIFDPYFTTKHKSDMHNGTGLGLSIAYQNMLEHSGIIEVDSNINEGTTFKVMLPHNHSKIEQNMDLR